jgi:hypothetical protein
MDKAGLEDRLERVLRGGLLKSAPAPRGDRTVRKVG